MHEYSRSWILVGWVLVIILTPRPKSVFEHLAAERWQHLLSLFIAFVFLMNFNNGETNHRYKLLSISFLSFVVAYSWNWNPNRITLHYISLHLSIFDQSTSQPLKDTTATATETETTSVTLFWVLASWVTSFSFRCMLQPSNRIN